MAVNVKDICRLLCLNYRELCEDSGGVKNNCEAIIPSGYAGIRFFKGIGNCASTVAEIEKNCEAIIPSGYAGIRFFIRKETGKMSSELKVPNHVAIILDGNGRWAKSKGMPRNYGHVQGAKTVEVICEEAYKMGIQYLTVYAFSTENWNRPQEEVEALMKLLRNYMKNCLKTAEKNRMCVRVIGDKTGLDEDIRNRIEELEDATKNNDGLHFQIAINYGGRDEITRAVNRIAMQVKDGQLEVQDITESLISQYLDTHGIPEPDLLIRTCNEQRISNFLLWQLAYTEFYFTPVPWPDFTKEELEKAIEAYNHRDRRYGLVKEESLC